jgi:antitoxin component of MazEF toxin-antitoxin module
LALRIPRAYAVETQISEGSKVELTLKSGALVVKPLTQKRYSLADLLKRVSPSNRHESFETGAPVGREVW